MKTNIITSLLFLFLPGFLLAQLKPDQNPRGEESYAKYRQQLNDHEQTMDATVDLTYEAYDPMVEKARLKQEKREFRQELKLERARSRRYNNQYYYRRPYYRDPYYRW